jgi:hypothetical protein
MTTGDAVVDKGADRLAELSDKAEQSGGVKAKLAPELRDDSAFLRKLKPGLIMERIRGQRGIEPSPADRPKAPKRTGAGPNPFVVAAAAFAAGVLMAKLIDWRGDAHPRV